MDVSAFLDDFESEARAHLEAIESAFLSVEKLAGDPSMISAIFRAAHSIKGTAGFFNLDKIVAVAHELENMFQKMTKGELRLNEEIVDVALDAVDCLNNLITHVNADDDIDVNNVLKKLSRYTLQSKLPASKPAVRRIPFDFDNPGIIKALKHAYRFGHNVYSVTVSFGASHARGYKQPKELIDNILSIGLILCAIINDDTGSMIMDNDSSVMSDGIVSALGGGGDSALAVLISSVLESELLLTALGLDGSSLCQIYKESIFGTLACLDEDDEPDVNPEFETLQPAAVDPAEPAGADATPASPRTEKATPPAHPAPARPAPARPAPARPAPAHPAPAHPAQAAAAAAQQQTIRLDAGIINQLMDLSNEMILTRNRLLSTLSNQKKSIPGLTGILNDVTRLTSDIQEKVMLTRMQPVSIIFNKFPRIIHDTARELKKSIEVEILNDKITLDKFLLESLTDPITQIVKNSADHGIEQAQQRSAMGKPGKGKISLNSFIRESTAIIEITDDGAGMDAAALGRKAVERKELTESEVSAMSKSELLALAFAPGISTAAKVTNLSGRGVGMDIVLTNIQKLGGSVEIESQPGEGTTIRLIMPITLSVTRTLIVLIGGVMYAVPEINVEHIVRIESGNSDKHLTSINKSLVLDLNGRIIPVVTMEDIEAKVHKKDRPDAKRLLKTAYQNGTAKCLVLKSGAVSFALLIDDALETEQTLVKPLPVFLKNSTIYSSTTILGNGRAIPIFDTEGIIRQMNLKMAETGTKLDVSDGLSDTRKKIIIFTCSGPEHFALETSDILRIETISPQDIRKIGTKFYVNISGRTVRVIRPETLMKLTKRTYKTDKLYILTIEGSTPAAGLLAGAVLDKAEGSFELDTTHFDNKYVCGTSTFGDNILIFLNPSAITGEVMQ